MARQCETIVLREPLAKFSRNEEICVALENTGAHCIAEAITYYKVWGVSLTASDLRAVSPPSLRGLNLLGKALERTR